MLLKTGIPRWYAEADFADNLLKTTTSEIPEEETVQRRVSKIEIERASDRVKVIIYTAKPGVVIGKGGAEIEKAES